MFPQILAIRSETYTFESRTSIYPNINKFRLTILVQEQR